MDLLNNIKKYDLKLCQILSHNKEDYLSYILRAYSDSGIYQHYLSYKKLERSDQHSFVYGDYPDALKYIGVTFPFVIGNTGIQVYKSLEVKTISFYGLYVPDKLEIRYNTITEFLEIGEYRHYSPRVVYFIQQKDHNLIWASHKNLSKKFEIDYKL
jgi:hypothetical protein